MICKMDKNKKVDYPCVRSCPLFGDCVVEFENTQEAKNQNHNRDTMKLFDFIKGMNEEELANYLAKISIRSMNDPVEASIDRIQEAFLVQLNSEYKPD